jgi:hypothetical protein
MRQGHAASKSAAWAIRTLDASIELRGKLTETPALWKGGPDLSLYMLDPKAGRTCGAVTLEFLIPPGATLFAYTL